MNSASLSDISYFLFIIPGFLLVWTYRHFTRSEEIGEFEYAALSFIWGVFLFMVLGVSLHFSHGTLHTVPLNDPSSALGSFLGISLVIAFAIAMPLGYVGAMLSAMGLLKTINKWLSEPINYLSKK